MRSRRSINVWPAFADLMTVLAVCGLFMTLALVRSASSSKEDATARLQEYERHRQELEERLRRQEVERKARESSWRLERENLRQQVREAARNEEMFRAIQEAQKFIDQISRNSGLTFGADQSLQFGDDLVSFKLNSLVPRWGPGSKERLHRFCQAISSQLADFPGRSSLKDLFIIQVEGHTDSTGCPGDSSCNWWISSGRAAAFVAVMRQPGYCPGGIEWNLRPVGYADTKPTFPGELPTRRIAVRLVPNYETLIKVFPTEPVLGSDLLK